MSESEKEGTEAKELTEPSFAEKLKGLLKDFEGSPDESVIEEWKSTHGDIFCSALSETELFVFRAVTRGEHREIQASVTEDSEYEENLVGTCLLWASVNDLEKKGGTLPTLLEQIMQNSNFMPPQLAGQLVIKL